MEIKDIKNRWVKISKTSITIKNDETGKTDGIVKNITRFTDLQANKQINYFKILNQSGIFGSGKTENTIIDTEGNIYFLFNVKGLEMQKEYFPEEYNKKMEFVENVQKYMEVIEVRF